MRAITPSWTSVWYYPDSSIDEDYALPGLVGFSARERLQTSVGTLLTIPTVAERYGVPLDAEIKGDEQIASSWVYAHQGKSSDQLEEALREHLGLDLGLEQPLSLYPELAGDVDAVWRAITAVAEGYPDRPVSFENGLVQSASTVVVLLGLQSFVAARTRVTPLLDPSASELRSHDSTSDLGRRRLNAELFVRDEEHAAYASAAKQLLASDEIEVPASVMQTAINHLTDVSARTGLDRQFQSWEAELKETFRSAYTLARLEDWSGVESDELTEIIEECQEETNAARVGVGSDPIGDEFSVWISILLLGVVHESPEWLFLNHYIFGEGAAQRLDSLRSTLESSKKRLGMGPLDDNGARDTLNHFAWRDGIVLAVLEMTGVLHQQTVGQAGVSPDARPLSGELFERDPQAYMLQAAQLASATAHRVPEVAKEFFWYLAQPIFERQRKVSQRYSKVLQDTFEAAFTVTQAETWDELKGDHARELMGRGLGAVIREMDSRDPRMLLGDPEYRIRNTAYGVAAERPTFRELNAYLNSQPSRQRLNQVAALMLTGVTESGVIKGRHRRTVDGMLALSWNLGTALGLLDLLGELPAAMPARLP